MHYFLMIFAGGIAGLFLAGPGGSIFGAIGGFTIAACQELAEDETDDANNSMCEWSGPDATAITHFSDFEPASSFIEDITFVDSDIGVGIGSEINPATCLPMISSGMGGVDVAGNPYGMGPDSDDFAIGSMSPSSSIFDDDYSI